ncbi:MAG: PAS domain S-box protein [Actinomycetota bacterium]|nr:PAS domain S-box protein [Actinomycetota bacterium]
MSAYVTLSEWDERSREVPEELITAAVDDYLEYFYGTFAIEDEASSYFALILASDVTTLRIFHRRFATQLLTPTLSLGETIDVLAQLGRVHARVGIRPIWMLKTNRKFAAILTERIDSSKLPREVVTRYLECALQRLDAITQAVLESEEELDEQIDQLNQEIDSAVANTTTSVDLVRTLVNVVCKLYGVVNADFSRPDKGGLFQYQYSSGDHDKKFLNYVENGELPKVSIARSSASGDHVASRAWRSGRVEICDSIEMDVGMRPWSRFLRGIGIRSIAALPIANIHGETVAVLTVYASTPGFFTISRRRRALEHIAHVVSSSLPRLDGGRAISLSERSAIRTRLYGGALEMVYQPIINLVTGEFTKVEALARLRDDDGRLISPAEFFPALGSEDLFYLFKEGVRQGFTSICQWRARGIYCGININLPSQGLRDPRYVEVVKAALRDFDLSPGVVTLELTEEEDLYSVSTATASNLTSFAEMRVHLAQDDLGAGYSSLLRLESFGFFEVKIDQGLIRSATDPVSSIDVVAHLTDLAHDLGMKVVVEGLERDALIEAVSLVGADFGQGYGISAPITFDAVIEWVNSYQPYPISNNVSTPLGAIAFLRRWSRRIGALGSYVSNISTSEIIREVTNGLGSLLDDKCRSIIEKFTNEREASHGAYAFVALEAELISVFSDRISRGATSSAANRRQDLSDWDSRVVGHGGIGTFQARDIVDLLFDGFNAFYSNGAIGDFYDVVCKRVEAIVPNSIAAVMLKGEIGTISVAACPSLDRERWFLLTDVPVGDTYGSCSFAVKHNVSTLVSSIAYDPRWKDALNIAHNLGLATCWSAPIRAVGGEVIGTFSISGYQEQDPTEFHRILLDATAEFISRAVVAYQRPDRFEAERRMLDSITSRADSIFFRYDRISGVISGLDQQTRRRLGLDVSSDVTIKFRDLGRLKGGSQLRAILESEYGKTNDTIVVVYDDTGVGRAFRIFIAPLDPESLTLGYLLLVRPDEDVYNAALWRERKLNRAVLNSVSAAIMVLDSNGRIVRFNRQAEELTGYSSIDVIYQTEVWRKWVAPEDHKMVVGAFVDTLRNGIGGVYEIWHHHRDGSRRLMEMHYKRIAEDNEDSDLAVVTYGIDVTSKSKALHQIETDLEFASQILDVVPQMIIVLDRSGRVVYCNDTVEDFTGKSLQELQSVPLTTLNFFSDEGRKGAIEWFESALEGQVISHSHAAWTRRDGERRIIEWQNRAIYDDLGTANFFVTVGTDLTTKIESDKQLRQGSTVFKISSEAIIVLDSDRKIIDINPAFTRMTGFEYADLLGDAGPSVTCKYASILEDGEVFQRITLGKDWSGPIRVPRKDGSEFAAIASISALAGRGGSIDLYVIMYTDITEIMETQQKLDFMAHHDPLTNLPNRTLLMAKTQDQLNRNKRSGKFTALAFFDLDDFKPVNDTFGHVIGDEILIAVARRIENCLREVDTVARIGGDEFVCILGDIADSEDARRVVDRILKSIKVPIVTSTHERVLVSASVGVSISYPGQDEPDALLRIADHLMYQVKNFGGDGIAIA